MLDLERFVAGVREKMKEVCQPLIARIEALEKRAPQQGPKGDPGEKGEPGKDGRDGIDGKGVDTQTIYETVCSWLEGHFATHPVKNGVDGKDGAPGRDGVDGKSVTLEEVRPFLEAELAKWALDFERRAQEVMQRAIDRMPKPKDGVDGKDGAPGRDALSVDDFELTLSDDERTLTVGLVCGEKRVEKSIRLSHPVHRGVYKPEQAYLKGDCVSFGGSTWSATRDTSAKPETDDSWRLIVKRGRDGKDGQRGEKGDKGDAGRNAQNVQHMHGIR